MSRRLRRASFPIPVLLLVAGAWVAQASEDRSSSARPFLGVQTEEEIDSPGGGARIVRVVPDSAAEVAGLREGDVIVRFDRREIHGPGSLGEAIRDAGPGDRVTIEVLRDGRNETLRIELGERPEPRRDYDPGDHGVWIGAPRPLLGVEIVEVTAELREHFGGKRERGVLVARVIEDSAAERAGIRVGDLIEAVEGEAIGRSRDLIQALRSRAGEQVAIELRRDGASRTVEASLPEADRERPRPRASEPGSAHTDDDAVASQREAPRARPEAIATSRTVRRSHASLY